MATLLSFFRRRGFRAGVVTLGTILKVSQWTQTAYAQQTQKVDILTIGGVSPLSAICDNSTGITSTSFAIAGTGATNVVQISASTARTYLCAYDFSNDAATVFVSIVSGDSTNCTTNSTITSLNFSSFSGAVKSGGGAGIVKPISSNSAICIKTASSGPVFGSLTYIQHGD